MEISVKVVSKIMKIEELGNLRWDRLDIALLLSNLRKFQDYAESSIEWQHRTQVQKLIIEANKDNLTPSEYYHQVEVHLNDDYQFVVPNAVRYSSLVMLVTYIEWFTKFCERYSDERNWGEPPSPKKKKILKKIDWLRSRQLEKFTHPFDSNIEALIELRNCIVHDAAIINNDHQKRAVEQLDGASLGRFLYMDNIIMLSKGAIEQLVTEAEDWTDSFLDYLDIGDRIPREFVIE